MSIKAEGQLQHHFWGKYHATIVLAFSSVEHAAKALASMLNGWKVSEKNQKVLFWHGSDDELKPIEEQLVSFGADAKKIKSMAKSIDFGERFSIDIAV